MRFSTSVILITVSLLCLARDVPPPLQGEHKATGVIYGKVKANYYDHGFRGASVYIFTMDQSKRLRQMDEEAYARSHAPSMDERQAGAIEVRTRDGLSNLASKLPRTALTKTGSKGNYAFKNLPAAKRYYVFVELIAEDGLYLAAGITPLLKDGQKLKFDLQIDNPWQDRFRAK